MHCLVLGVKIYCAIREVSLTIITALLCNCSALTLKIDWLMSRGLGPERYCQRILALPRLAWLLQFSHRRVSIQSDRQLLSSLLGTLDGKHASHGKPILQLPRVRQMCSSKCCSRSIGLLGRKLLLKVDYWCTALVLLYCRFFKSFLTSLSSSIERSSRLSVKSCYRRILSSQLREPVQNCLLFMLTLALIGLDTVRSLTAARRKMSVMAKRLILRPEKMCSMHFVFC